jgi:hypothetical protein
MNCETCGVEVAAHVDRCQACMRDVGFPNVRAATSVQENEALAERVRVAFESAQANSCEGALFRFGGAVARAHVVVSRSLSDLRRIVDSENQLFSPFYGQVSGGSRLPENNRFDPARPGVDGTLFPYYAERISFGALSLDGVGVGGNYGGCHLTLRDSSISHRATVFEENAYVFCVVKRRTGVGGPIPAGYRASWEDRAKLAQAKHYAELKASMPDDEFPRVLLRRAQSPEAETFVEVHIYGGLHRSCLQEVAFGPDNEEDRIIWTSLKRSLVKLGVSVSELP